MPSVRIIDSTLREGEQVAGVALSSSDKGTLVKLLDRAGIAELDVGMVGVSDSEDAVLASLTRLTLDRVQLSVATLIHNDQISRARDFGYGIISLVIPISAAAADALLRERAQDTLDRARSAVDSATRLGLRVNAALVDASREEVPVVVERAHLLVESGAGCVIYCDSAGCLTPDRVAQAVAALVSSVGSRCEVCVHLHNDFGLATANALAAVQAGAGAVHVTVNGIGERAGVSSLAEVVLGCEGLLGYTTGVRLDALIELARTVERITGVIERPYAPGVGVSTFCCETGIVAGTMNSPDSPYVSVVGSMLKREIQLSFGKHSGRRALTSGLNDLRITLVPEHLARCLAAVKESGERRSLQAAAPLEDAIRRYHALLDQRRIDRNDLASMARDSEASGSRPSMRDAPRTLPDS